MRLTISVTGIAFVTPLERLRSPFCTRALHQTVPTVAVSARKIRPAPPIVSRRP